MTQVLLALDCSAQARRVVDYACGILPHLPDCRVVLLSVLTGVPYGPEELVHLSDAPFDSEVHGDEDHHQEALQLRSCLHSGAERLQQAGLASDRVKLVLRPERRGIAQDILDAAAELGCDTLVVGRRGQSRLKNLLQGSVSREVVQKGTSLTVWVVG